MAFNKAKALEEGHKYVTQGKIARAIRQYQWILEKDPGDLTLLNVIGDLYARDNNIPEALKYFHKLAEAYSREGYKVKAVAIYKKISKIDRNSVEPMVRLAELNAGLGLSREAREQYKNAFEFFERMGQKDKALGMLRELCQLDPNSPGLRLKLAEFAERTRETQQAVDAYLEAAVLARQHGDDAALEAALNKAAELAPENSQVRLYRARQALTSQRPEEVKAILDFDPDLRSDPQAQRLLLQSYLAAGDLNAAREVLLDVFHKNLPDFSAVAEFATHCIDRQQYDAAFEILTVTAPEMIARRETGPLMETLRALWKAAPERIDILEFTYQVAEKAADEAAIPEVLETLGNAYVRSGQFEKAEQSYARLVAREPENETYKDRLKQVLQRQGKEYVPLGATPFINAGMGLDAGPESTAEGAATAVDSVQAAIVKGAITNSDFFVRDGLTERAMEELEKVLRLYPDQPDIQKRILEISREEFPRRAVQAAEGLAQACSAQGDSSAAKRYHEEALELAQTAAGEETGSAPPLQQEPPEQPASGEAEPPPPSFKIDLSQAAQGQETADEEAQLPAPQEIALQFETCQEAGPAADVSSALEGSHAGTQTSPSPGPVHRESAPDEASGFNYDEHREEIEFYLRYGFHDEARKAVSELERRFPEESRVADLRKRVGESGQEGSAPEKSHVDAGMAAKEAPGREWELPTSFSGPSAGERVSGEELHDAVSASATSIASQEQDAAVVSAGDASAGLGSLLDELNEDSGPTVQTAEDDQTHYNLGVAFREMGLLDEAIGEFQKVVKGGGPKTFGPNFLQGCTLLAACFMDKAMPAIAAKWYERALEIPGLEHEGRLALYYDLGIAFEKAGNTAAALEKFTEVYSQNIDYRDVAEKIRLLRQSTS